MVQGALPLPVVHFQVGQGSGAAGAPVDDPLVAVDEALVVQVDEGGAHGTAGAGIQREAQPVPVSGDAQTLGLAMDDAAVLPDVLPDQFLELFPAQLAAVPALGGQPLLHGPLGGDAGVVGAWQPQGGVAGHAPPAHQGVLYGLFQGVAEVQLPGDVGRGHDDGEGLTAGLDLGGKVAPVQPVLVQPLLDGGGVVGPGHVGGGRGGGGGCHAGAFSRLGFRAACSSWRSLRMPLRVSLATRAGSHIFRRRLCSQ